MLVDNHNDHYWWLRAQGGASITAAFGTDTGQLTQPRSSGMSQIRCARNTHPICRTKYLIKVTQQHQLI